MNAIVSVCDDWGIGLDGQLLVPNRADMRRFRTLTSGKAPVAAEDAASKQDADASDAPAMPILVMGRKTAESFPGGKPLPGRRNVVLTRNPDWKLEGFEVVASPSQLDELLADADPDTVWLVGGEMIYRLLLPLCERAFVTKNHTVCEADAYFPNLDEDPAWRVESTEPGGTTDAGVDFDFLTYVRV